MTVLITGGSGMIGSAISKALIAKGHAVSILTRKLPAEPPSQGLRYHQWNPEKGLMDAAAIRTADAIVHLAGANVGDGRWTAARRLT